MFKHVINARCKMVTQKERTYYTRNKVQKPAGYRDETDGHHQY